MTSLFSTSNNSIDSLFIVPSLFNLPFTISIKLNSSNYPVWKAQTLPYFKGHGALVILMVQSQSHYKKLMLFILARCWYQNSQSSIYSMASSRFFNPRHHQCLTHWRCFHSNHVLYNISRGLACIRANLFLNFTCKDYLNSHSTGKCL